MQTIVTSSVAETEAVGARLAATLRAGHVVALFGGLGAGKTAFVRGLAAGLGLTAAVSSPTFALVHDYGQPPGGGPPLVHFDMYRVSGWDDLYTTGWDDYLSGGAILAVEWSEHIEAALPPEAIRVTIRPEEDCRRIITVERPNR